MRLNDKKIRAKQIVEKIVDDIYDSDNEELAKAWSEIEFEEQGEIIKRWQEIIVSNLPSGEDDKDK